MKNKDKIARAIALENSSQLSDITTNQLPKKRNTTDKIGLSDMSSDAVSAFNGTGTIPPDLSVTPPKTTFMSDYKNLYNKNDSTNNNDYALTAGGALSAMTGRFITHLIPVKANIQYVLLASAYIVLGKLYTSSTPLTTSSSGASITLTDYATNTKSFTPSSDGYIAFSILGSSSTTKVNVSKLSEYDGNYYDYLTAYLNNRNIDKTLIKTSEINNDNGFVKNTDVFNTIAGNYKNLFNKDDTKNKADSTLTAGGALASFAGRFITHKIPVDSGIEYSLLTTGYVVSCYLYSDNNDITVSSSGTSVTMDTDVDNSNHKTIVASSNGYVVFIILGTPSSEPINFSLSSEYDGFYYDYQSKYIQDIYVNHKTIKTSEINNDAEFVTPLSLGSLTWYKNKKLCTFGDSITAQGLWQNYIINYFGMSYHANRGIGGTTVHNDGATAYINADGVGVAQGTAGATAINSWMCSDDRINTIPSDSDIILVFAGHNDWGEQTTIGAVGTALADNQFIPAYALMLKKLITNFPNARIITMTPIGGRTPAETENTDTQMYLNGACMTDFANAVKSVSAYYGIPCIDINAESGINTINHTTYITDVIHPNANGGKLVANATINGMKRFEPMVL